MNLQSPVFPRALYHVGWRYLLRHPLQSLLMVLGITLGVAVVVAIDLANTSASRAFDLSVDSIAGKATHQIVAGTQGVDEALYTEIRRQGILREVAPVVSDTISSPELGGRPLQLLGVDPFAEAPFRSYLGGEDVPLAGLTAFLTQPNALLISVDMAERYGLEQGESITIQYSGRRHDAVIAGLLDPSDSLSRRTLNGVVLTDIASAQEIMGKVGRLTSIDLILPEDDSRIENELAGLLPEGVRLIQVDGRSGTVEQMTQAFRTNLLALSLLALIVGMFLIYNTMTFSIVQRRPLFGTLRCLGVTRQEVFLLVMSEALTIGLIGGVLGVALGVLLGQGAVQLVTQTINDLFFTTTVSGTRILPESLAKGFVLGLLATVLTAAPPAWEAASVPPRAALSRSGLEDKAQRAVWLVTGGGVALLLAGGGLLLIPTRNLIISFTATFFVLVAFAMMTPLLMEGFMRLAMPVTGALLGPLGRMAPRAVVKSISRTSIAVAALMVAVSVTIGISVMVSSFRHTVILWLAQTLQGDVYISVPGGVEARPTASIDPGVIARLEAWPGVARVDTVRVAAVESPEGVASVLAVNNPDEENVRNYLWRIVEPGRIWEVLLEGESVLVSEPYANRLGIRQGSSVTLYTGEGPREFKVIGVYYDYGSTEGEVLMAQSVYRALWDDNGVTAASLELEPGADPDALTVALQDALMPVQALSIRPNRALRDDVLVVFDRTFAITGALNLLSTVVAFVGVLSALLALQLEKGREIGVLRAIGLTGRQMWGLVSLETGLMGLTAGLFSLPTGYVLSLILVYIINRRSFGWTLLMQVAPGPFLMALLVAVAAALLAGLYPAFRMGRMAAAEAIRFE